MILIRAGFCDDIDLRGFTSELSRVNAGLNFKLLECVDRRHHYKSVEVRVGVFHAIQRVVIEVGALPAHRNRLSGTNAALPRTGLSLAGEAGGYVGRQRDELKIISSIERQFDNPP